MKCTPDNRSESTETDPSSQIRMDFDLQGHRGARGLFPENTIPAFLYAIDQGVTTLEMDVVITRDSQVVVSHEPWLSSRICSKSDGTPISEEEEKGLNLFTMTYEEISTYDCGRRGHPDFPRQKPIEVTKPTLEGVIEYVEQYVRTNNLAPLNYNIETKSSPEGDGVYHPEPAVFTKLLLDIIRAFDVADRTTIQSFDVRTLQASRQMAPDVSLALLVGSHDTMDFEAHLDHLGFIPEIYSPNYNLVDTPLIEAVHAKGMLIIPWTVNTLEEMIALKSLGVDGIITDYPDIGRTLLTQ